MIDTTPRIDAFYASLDEDGRWALYDKMKKAEWFVAAQYCEEQLQLPKPSKNAWYNFKAKMREADSERRIILLRTARSEAEAMAKRAKISSMDFVEALKTLAVDKAMDGEASEAVRFAQSAAQIWDRAQKEKELELKERRQSTAEDQLKLAREKFEAAERRLNEVKDVTQSSTLTDEERVAKIKSIFGLK
ncbi:MAG: hypothetical protein IJQ34_00735 [Kiritimatiellae bacterium]|nr:hypothetical protein [Kiritimatiellia bacterium]